MSLPDFMIGGVPKAGTTALRSALRQHPELYLPKIKEPKFFLTGDWTHLWSAGLEPIGDLVRACEAGQRRIADGWGHFWHYTRGPAPRSVHIAQAPARRPDRAGRGPAPAPRPLSWEQRQRLLPYFAEDIRLLQHVTGEDFSDWLRPRERWGGLVGARSPGQRQSRNGRRP